VLDGLAIALHAVTAAAAGLVLAGGFLAWRHWQTAGAGWPGDTDSPEDRNRLVGIIGVGVSGFSLLALIGQATANFVLHPCQ
jgi:hypothetical protein